MTFLDAVIDTLLPGDDALPAGTVARVRIERAMHRAVLGAIARAAGSEEAFAGADATRRARVIREVERAHPDALAALLYALVEEYYDSDAVISAMGWTIESPQPNGHPLPAFDDDLLASVRRRSPFWRDAPPR